MNIIKPGTELNRRPRPVRFTCHACGCVFELDWEELKDWPSHSDRNTQYAECPNCKAWAEETVMR